MAHTPGPWFSGGPNAKGNYLVFRDGDSGMMEDVVATINGDRPADREANASLIAASPDMLAVVKRFADAMEQKPYPELQGVACDAFAAIAKAGGA